MNALLTILMAALLSSVTALAQGKVFKRIEQYPKGEQIALYGEQVQALNVTVNSTYL